MEEDKSQNQHQRNWEMEKNLMEHQHIKCDMLESENEKLLFEQGKLNKEIYLEELKKQLHRDVRNAELEIRQRIAMRVLQIKKLEASLQGQNE